LAWGPMCLMPGTEISPPICLDGGIRGNIIVPPSKTVGQECIGDTRYWVSSVLWMKSAATQLISTAKVTEPYCQATITTTMSTVTGLSMAETSGRLVIPEQERPS